MKITYNELDAYQKHIIDSIELDENEQPLTDPEEKVKYIFRRFYSEKSYEIQRLKDEFRVMVDWLQGLALPLPFTHYDILEVAKSLGILDLNPTEHEEEIVLARHWKFLARNIFDIGVLFKVIDRYPS